jgi:hypothetical protein
LDIARIRLCHNVAMPQPLPSKEQTLFRSLVKYYEGKQYKKGARAPTQHHRQLASLTPR